MATWQFWTLFTVLVLIFLTLQGIHGAAKALWTKLHELQAMIGRIPGLRLPTRPRTALRGPGAR
jgi:hypothetical protein